MGKLSPAARSLQARRAALLKWARTDPKEGTLAARRAFRDSFYDQTDPSLPEPERRRRAEALRKAHYAELALKSVQARKK
jgi:hypothetical protein